MVRLYEEMTGVTIHSVEEAQRVIDDEDDEDEDDDNSAQVDAIDRARRKSIRRSSMGFGLLNSKNARELETEPVLQHKCEQKGSKGSECSVIILNDNLQN